MEEHITRWAKSDDRRLRGGLRTVYVEEGTRKKWRDESSTRGRPNCKVGCVIEDVRGVFLGR